MAFDKKGGFEYLKNSRRSMDSMLLVIGALLSDFSDNFIIKNDRIHG